jgi:hypothetical protein
VDDYITILCRQHAQVIHNHENVHIRIIGQYEIRHGKYKYLEIGGGQAFDLSSDKTDVVA